ncbi:hypothetical protein [Nocardia transvalensis]|uniref:hypothetical protein n=1 Tax=Nocardia transvalensis TaxID=37333 RepID=UPI0018953B35|nr:hypothetical protein [Nocardia transvalensis]MBF6332975.1 hypothetical protein [Nocardia transvalensis]
MSTSKYPTALPSVHGGGVIVCAGITIGANTVVGAGSVVTTLGKVTTTQNAR